MTSREVELTAARPLIKFQKNDGAGANGTAESGSGSSSGSSHGGHGKLGWLMTAVFIVADMVGGGVVAMPVAFKQSGLLAGCIFMVVIAAIFEYTGYQLGVVWCIMQKRWPEYHQPCRKPFPEIAKRAMGQQAGRITSLLVNVTLFGICVVYLLLSAQILHYFVELISGREVSVCHVITALAVMLLPFTMLKSPSDFWAVIVLAMATTTLAVIMIMWGITQDASACMSDVKYEQPGMDTVMASLGIFLFAFSGHYVFPTIQHDMREPKDFTKSVVLGFLCVVLLYMPLSVWGYTVYGDSLSNQSVIYSIQTEWLQVGANLMIAVHCILTLVIVINPINQEVEEIFNVSHSFGKGRIAVRCTLLALVLFTGLSMPEFGPVMKLVGASTIPIGCVLMPSFFYLYIRATDEDEWTKGKIPSIADVVRRTSTRTLVLNAFIVLVALGGMVLGTEKALGQLAEAKFLAPCYVRPFLDQQEGQQHSVKFVMKQLCCGASRNISTFGHLECGDIAY